ncbi:Hypothetical predicted protein, partial [Podarcis lilfordi]
MSSPGSSLLGPSSCQPPSGSKKSTTEVQRPRTPRMGVGAFLYFSQPSKRETISLMKVQKCTPGSGSRPYMIRLAGSSITIKYKKEGVKIPWTPKYPKTGSNRV